MNINVVEYQFTFQLSVLLDLLNRYIVYDVAQINMKYLLKTKFKYKSGGFFW